MQTTSFIQKNLELQELNSDFVCVTITQVRGSAPQELGAKMLVTSKGLEWGTVGGGRVEAHCINFAKDILSDSKSRTVQEHKWNLQTDIKMTCGGEVRFLFEKISPTSHWNIAIFGAGHVSNALCRVLSLLNCHVKVIDTRQEWLAKIIDHPRIEKIQTGELKDVLSLLEPESFIVSMTMGHAHDVPILFESLQKYNFPYLGVIGSQSKRNAIVHDLRELGLSEKKCEHFHCPIGEKFGRNEPAEIAMSIVAQLLIHRDKTK